VFNGATSASGNNRIDNIVFEGTPINDETPVPEPASILLLGFGLTVTGGYVRRRRLMKTSQLGSRPQRNT
jgi:hypothetical protein